MLTSVDVELYRQTTEEAAGARRRSQIVIQTSVEICATAVALCAEARALCARNMELQLVARHSSRSSHARASHAPGRVPSLRGRSAEDKKAP
jgi:hypothetical protein